MTADDDGLIRVRRAAKGGDDVVVLHRPILKWLRMSNSSTTGSFFSTSALISLYCVLSSLMSEAQAACPRRREAVEHAQRWLGVAVGLGGDGGVADWIVPSAPASTRAS